MIYRITEYKKETDTWELVSKGPQPSYYRSGKPRLYHTKGYAKNGLRALEEIIRIVLRRDSNYDPPIYRIEQSDTDWKPLND